MHKRADSADKLAKLCEIEGLDEMALLERDTFDSVCAGICTNAGCDYSCQVEPDSDSGWCEVCNLNTVCSSLMLAGII